ncbi:MAG: MotA/TolQ/ExbB proton channel family protein [Candidatus Eisenbacteria bacterium]|nr:MotA/TolQ/ExbB proton channel family protein [Candidatus Eisenbacteria bacterium]
MKGYVFLPILVLAVLVSLAIYKYMLPDFIRLGGYLVPILMTLSILSLTFIVERLITLKRAQGRGDMNAFARNLKKNIDANQIQAAIDVCKKQGGSLANVVGAGLERYHFLKGSANLPKDELIEETRRAIEEANALETPLLERNLIALSTIASIATMVGLLGTTIGMIRSFKAMGHAGAADAIQLAIGISEALINTAGGLFLAIISIVMYNYFTNRVDSFNYNMDETTYEVVQLLEHQKESARGQG